MDKRIYNKSLNKKLLIPKLLTNNDHSQYETPQSATKSNEDNIIDYRNISLTLTGELSSSCIHRDNLTQKQPNVMLVEDAEDDDEQFISNMKKIIDKNYKMQNKENHSLRNLQSKSYLSKKKKCVFSDEDQNLIKRFKKSVNESKNLHTTSQKPELQQPENVASISNSKCSIITSTPETASIITLSNTDFNRNDTNQSLHIISQKNDQLISRNTEIVAQTEIVEPEIKRFLCCDVSYLTPPQTDK